MSRRAFEFTAAARLDLLEAWNYLAENASLRVADKTIDDIRTAVRAIARGDRQGHRRPDVTDKDLLFYRVHSYLIIYQPSLRPLRVIRVWHAARDVADLDLY